MPPEFYERPDYKAVYPAVENATGRGKEPHAITNMVLRCFVHHLENIQVAPPPEGLKVNILI